MSITSPLSVSTCANASPVFESSRPPRAHDRRGVAGAGLEPVVDRRVEVGRDEQRLSAIPAPVSSTAITPVNARVSLNRSGIRLIRRSSDPLRRPI